MSQDIITANTIFSKIKDKVPVKFDNIIINEDLDVSKYGLKNENEKFFVESIIKITNSEIKGKVEFGNTIFENLVDFTGTHFKKDAEFLDSQFKENSIFSSSKFEKNAFFTNSKFNKDANFKYCQFSLESRYYAADFGGVRFESDAIYEEIQFDGDAIFQNSRFDKTARFTESKFIGYAIFENIRFKEDAFLDRCTFYLTLSLKRTKYETMYIEWENIRKPPKNRLKFWDKTIALETVALDYDDATYLLLIDNYKKQGFFEDADNCYYYFRNKRRESLSIHYWLIDCILMILYGYSVRPFRPLIWAIFFFIAFGLLYATQPDAIGISNPISFVEAFNNSSIIFLSGTQLIGTPNYLAQGLLPYWIFTLEKLFGSLCFALFLVSVGKTMIR